MIYLTIDWSENWTIEVWLGQVSVDHRRNHQPDHQRDHQRNHRVDHPRDQ